MNTVKWGLQHLTSCFAEAAQLFGLEISLKKTEVLHQPAPLEKYPPPHITLSGTELKTVPSLIWGVPSHQMPRSTGKWTTDWPRQTTLLADSTKEYGTTSIWRRVLRSVLLYGSESWVTYHHHVWLLEHFHQRCLHTILNIHWSNYVSNVEVLDQAEITSIEAMLLKSQLQWAVHVSRIGKAITCPR